MQCSQCGTPTEEGMRFCPGCGRRLGSEVVSGVAEDRNRGPGLPLALAAALLVGVLAVAMLPLGSGDPTPAPTTGALGPAPQVDLASMTPGEAADRLYLRVTRALADEDEVEVMNFLPMALDAHEIARPLNVRRLFNYSYLLRMAQEPEQALEVAREGLEREPDHLLNLSAAAEASLELGDESAAREYYGRMLEVWDAELEQNAAAYEGYEELLPVIRTEGETIVEEL